MKTARDPELCGSKLLGWSIALLSLFGSQVPLSSNPRNPTVVRGAAGFHQSGNHLRIQQHSQRAVIDWQSFSIGIDEITEFSQPNSTAAALNRVVGTQQSVINGQLLANGQVFLLNANGILIGQSGRIDVAGFVASTLDVDNDQFMAGGDLRFHGASTAAIVNLGAVSATGGDVILIGLPGECFVEYALDIKARCPHRAFVISLANGELQGYIVTEETADQGGYEASNGIFDSQSGKMLVDKSLELMRTRSG